MYQITEGAIISGIDYWTDDNFKISIGNVLNAWNRNCETGKFFMDMTNHPWFTGTETVYKIEIYYISNVLRKYYLYNVLSHERVLNPTNYEVHKPFMNYLIYNQLVNMAALYKVEPDKKSFKGCLHFPPVFTIGELITGEYEKWVNSELSKE